MSYQLDALQNPIISTGKQVLLLGGQTASARNGGLLRIAALSGAETEEKSSGIIYTGKKGGLAIKGARIFRYNYSYLAYRQPTSCLGFGWCFFFKHKLSTACQINICIQIGN